MTRTRSRDLLVPFHSSSSGERPSKASPSLSSSSSTSYHSASPIASSHSSFRNQIQFAVAVTLLLAFASQLAFADSPPEIPFDLVLHHEGKLQLGIIFSFFKLRLEGAFLPAPVFTSPHSLCLLLIYVHKVLQTHKVQSFSSLLFTFLLRFPTFQPHHQVHCDVVATFLHAGLLTSMNEFHCTLFSNHLLLCCICKLPFTRVFYVC